MRIKHNVVDMLPQRVYGLALGWEDLNDHSALHSDIAMQTAVGVDDQIASAPTLCRLQKCAVRSSAVRLHQVLVEQVIASFKTIPEELVRDFDATDHPLYATAGGLLLPWLLRLLLLSSTVRILWSAAAVRLPAPKSH